MARRRIQWRHVKSYFTKRGYHIYNLNGNEFIAEPVKEIGKPRETVRITRDCCIRPSAEVTRPYLEKITDVFGVTPEEIMKDFS